MLKTLIKAKLEMRIQNTGTTVAAVFRTVSHTVDETVIFAQQIVNQTNRFSSKTESHKCSVYPFHVSVYIQLTEETISLLTKLPVSV